MTHDEYLTALDALPPEALEDIMDRVDLGWRSHYRDLSQAIDYCENTEPFRDAFDDYMREIAHG